MKTKLLIGALALGLLVFNFSINDGNVSKKDYALQNVKIMQCNAGESYCDQADETSCTIVVVTSGGRIVGNSTGNVKGSF
jgi:hypothetical protein